MDPLVEPVAAGDREADALSTFEGTVGLADGEPLVNGGGGRTTATPAALDAVHDMDPATAP